MSILEELRTAVDSAAERAGSAVVRVGRAGGRGAGVVTGPGVVVTSAHNLRGEEITVTFADGRVATGTVTGVDVEGDLAAVAVDTGGIAPVEWAEAAPGLGATVLALALPAATTGVRVTVGTVSAAGAAFRGPRGRLITDAIEHTAPLGRGSSGGPLLDLEGRLVAINTHRPGDGLYLAIPTSAALRTRIDALSRGENPTRRRLGVALAPPQVARRLRASVGLEPRDGVLVREVAEDSPAAAAGIQAGDLVIAAGGQPVASIDALLAAVDGVGDGATLELGLLRGADERTVTVRWPEPSAGTDQ
jgi:serine protease Do